MTSTTTLGMWLPTEVITGIDELAAQLRCAHAWLVGQLLAIGVEHGWRCTADLRDIYLLGPGEWTQLEAVLVDPLHGHHVVWGRTHSPERDLISGYYLVRDRDFTVHVLTRFDVIEGVEVLERVIPLDADEDGEMTLGSAVEPV